MTRDRRKASGLVVCGLIVAWLFATDVNRRIDDAQSAGDDAAYTAREADRKADDLERRVEEMSSYRGY